MKAVLQTIWNVIKKAWHLLAVFFGCTCSTSSSSSGCSCCSEETDDGSDTETE